MSIVELREYKLKPRMREQWLSWMQADILPYQISKGMRVLQTYIYTDENDAEWFVWLREFDNEAHRQQVYANTYDEWWRREIRPRVFEMIEQESIRVRLLSPVHVVS
ncbi:NIPSNAP family protein [Oceanisphaera psychrotolerans]|uniref:NIPSNAP domain-containing protein n=1 Tax=Oceanisphaera psychrotolerans TaxID=1414654 RepID=A0A1J4QE03_9GAMM|nr:NIPSNAP family protein [Oceanisphaera psychrotolerans]OIN07932.1 hypothetical protein BFR47_16070 [Oceanisphaera psychrotolerans]